MSDLIDYLNWRGDLTFAQAPFNEVDNLILSQLAYINFEGIVPGTRYQESVSLEEACNLFYTLHPEKKDSHTKAPYSSALTTMKEMAITQRFKTIRLGQYVNHVDYLEEKQFSAIQYDLGNDMLYVAFRGTDDTLVGWKEDFNMSFMMPVPSQLAAVSYVNSTLLHQQDKHLYLGGHSKGGNLAIYAGVYCDATIKERICHIYNNDGPGFSLPMLESPAYQALLPKVTTIVPQSSIVGILLEHEEEYKIVRSKRIGILQHNAMSWEVLGPQFIYCQSLSKTSQIFDHTIKNWLGSLTKAQRELFIETLYGLLETTGAKTFTDLTTSKLKKINLLLKSYNALDDSTRQMIFETLKQLTTCYYHVFKDSLPDRHVRHPH